MEDNKTDSVIRFIDGYNVKITNQDTLILQCKKMIGISRGEQEEVLEYKKELSILRAVRQNYVQFVSDLEEIQDRILGNIK